MEKIFFWQMNTKKARNHLNNWLINLHFDYERRIQHPASIKNLTFKYKSIDTNFWFKESRVESYNWVHCAVYSKKKFCPIFVRTNPSLFERIRLQNYFIVFLTEPEEPQTSSTVQTYQWLQGTHNAARQCSTPKAKLTDAMMI